MEDRSATSEREVRAARNQAIFRAVNDEIMELSDELCVDGTVGIACECSDPRCAQLLEIGAEAYEALRCSPRTFAVLPNHVDLEVERVIAASGEYAVVEVTGAAAVAFLEPEGSDLRRRAAALRLESRLLRGAARESRQRSLLARARSELLQEKLTRAAVQGRSDGE